MQRYGPRRAAAIQANILITGQALAPLPPPPPPPPPAPGCLVCQQPYDLNKQDCEMCWSCHHWAHHACMARILVPYDRDCRGLCLHQPPNPNGLMEVNCPRAECGARFRPNLEETRDRWLQIFMTQKWRAYIKKLQPQNNRPRTRMVPSIGKQDIWWWEVYQPFDDYFLKHHVDRSLEPRPNNPEYWIVDPRAQSYQYNQAGHPVRLAQASFDWYVNHRQQVQAGTNLPEERWRTLIVHPSSNLHGNTDNPHQVYMFSELNYLMHDKKRLPWKGVLSRF